MIVVEGRFEVYKGKKESYQDVMRSSRCCRIEWDASDGKMWVEVVDGKKERRGGRKGRVLKYFLGGRGVARRGEKRHRARGTAGDSL